MHHHCLLRCGCPVVTAVLLILLFSGCGDDKPASPVLNPKVTMSLQDDNGRPYLTVRNSGGSMSEPSAFIASFEDGECDTLFLQLNAGDSASCLLSNIHGYVTVINEDWDLEATIGDCLASYLENLVVSIVLDDYIPSPITEGTYLLCTYQIYLDDINSNSTSFHITRTDDGLTLTYAYHNVTGDLTGTSPGLLCPDFTGNIAISSVVVETFITIGEGDDPEITLGGSDATVNGLQVNVDGVFGFVVEWIAGLFFPNYLSSIEDAIVTVINSSVGTDLSYFVIVNTDCAE